MRALTATNVGDHRRAEAFAVMRARTVGKASADLVVPEEDLVDVALRAADLATAIDSMGLKTVPAEIGHRDLSRP